MVDSSALEESEAEAVAERVISVVADAVALKSLLLETLAMSVTLADSTEEPVTVGMEVFDATVDVSAGSVMLSVTESVAEAVPEVESVANWALVETEPVS